MRIITLALAVPLCLPPRAFAAVGCDLNDPDRDVARLFSGATGFKTSYVSIKDQGGAALLSRIEARLGDKFKGLYETIDVPYTIYEVLKDRRKVGYIHGVNQKGVYGGIQVFVALDLAGTIKAFYVQKVTSRHAKALRGPEFGKQFEGLNLDDFQGYAVVSGKSPDGLSHQESRARGGEGLSLGAARRQEESHPDG